MSSSSGVDLTTTPLFFVGEPMLSTGLISIAKDGALLLSPGSRKRNTPGIFVGFRSQSFPCVRNSRNRSVTDISLSSILATTFIFYMNYFSDHTVSISSVTGNVVKYVIHFNVSTDY